MFTLKRLHDKAKSRCDGRPAFTLLELIVVLLVLGILAAIAVPTFNRVKENATVRVAQTTLEAIDRNGEAIARSDGNASDEAIAAAVESELPDQAGVTVSVGSGADADKITVTYVRGGITATGSVTFTDGVGTIVDAVVDGGAGATTTTTAAPTTTTTAAPTTTTTTVAPGAYSVGDTGPGGGVVFAVFATPFACGPTLASTCTYLEAAPSSFGNTAWSGNTNTVVGTNDGLGYGYQNTTSAVAQDSTANRAVTLADSYSNSGQTDWFLPSRAELNELCKYANQETTGNTAVMCAGSGPLRAGFSNATYWSSSEGDTPASQARGQDFSTWASGNQPNANKVSVARVYPVRAG